MPYVVTKPDSIRGVYDTWAECKLKVTGVAGAVYQKVENDGQAQLLLAGTSVVLPPGLHVFTDGNHLGGVGVVVVWAANAGRAECTVVAEISASVGQVFYDGKIPGLGSDDAVRTALARSRNVLAELAGLYLALWQAPAQARLTIVHDFEGVGAWLEGRWRAKDATVKAVVSACKALAEEKGLHLEFVWQRGHASTWAGRNDFARFNNRADELATQGSSSRDDS
ncbi:MAG TPA: ribonuclease H family protein [Actinomycetota bacterium]|nr:ribonuclease H family protein [Actinomycetota bacterium]